MEEIMRVDPEIDPEIESMRLLYCDDTLSHQQLKDLSAEIFDCIQLLTDEQVAKFYEYPRFNTVAGIGMGSVFIYLGYLSLAMFGVDTISGGSIRTMKVMFGAMVTSWLVGTVGEEAAHSRHRNFVQRFVQEAPRADCFLCELKHTHVKPSEEHMTAQHHRKWLARATVYQLIFDRTKLSIWKTFVPVREQDEQIKQVNWTLCRRLRLSLQKPQVRRRSRSWP